MIPGFFAVQAVNQGPRLWTPADLPVPPAIWLDDQSPVTDAGGGACSQWNDRSGGGHHFSQGSSGFRPLIVPSGLNSRRILRFDGTSDRLFNSTSASALTAETDATWLLTVVKRNVVDATSTDRVLWATTSGTGGTRFTTSLGQPSNLNQPAMTVRRLDGDSSSVIRGSGAGTDWVIYLTAIDYQTGEGRIYTDGDLETGPTSLTSTGSTSNTPSSSGIYLGSWVTGAAACDCDVAVNLFGVGSVPSAIDIDRLHGWAAWRFGLQGLLPIGHPYKDAPPYV